MMFCFTRKYKALTYSLSDIESLINDSLKIFVQLGINFPNYSYLIGVIYGIEIIATLFLMGVILIVVHKKSLNKLTGIGIGGIIALDVFFFGPISGASMNPIRSLVPALLTGIHGDLWLYWTATFIGSLIAGLIYRKKFHPILNK